jgi:hypothetical protein
MRQIGSIFGVIWKGEEREDTAARGEEDLALVEDGDLDGLVGRRGQVENDLDAEL